MLEELMSQYVDVDNKDFWDDSVSCLSLSQICASSIDTRWIIGLQALPCCILSFAALYQHQV